MTLISMLIAKVAQGYYRKEITIIADHKINRGKISLKKWKIYICLSALPSILIAGLRMEVGSDYVNYLKPNMYIGSVFCGEPISMEPLYRALVEIGYKLGNEQIVFFLTAFIFSYFMYRFICENSVDWAYSVLLLLLTGTFSQSLNIMRQMAAIAICLYAIKYAKEGALKKYLFWIICAMGIHYMAAIYLVFYPICNRKCRNIKIGYKKGGIILIFLGLTYILSGILLQYLYKILLMSGISYASYFGSNRDSGTSSALVIVQLVILSLLIFINEVGVTLETKAENIWIYFGMFTCGILAIGLPNANRLAYLFIPAQIVALPNAISSLPNIKVKRAVKSMCIILLVVFWYYYFFKLNISETFPYKFI